ncbi:sulfotransferase [Halomonas caseinilytica]|uniref:Sulfotransferase family protein n=1 Tax=Halomonas caseinilytica TaxID=438744 RepID=A0A1M6NN50_9GAMM|nr:sulfotransferase [Halomonas caseinilytica]SHJ97064.1 Sulfotransferase family protein [Halomonas caseinilytica]
MGKNNLPNFLCIGAQKAGTTWLDKQLRAHPKIWMPPMKEVHYFDYVYNQDFRRWITWHLRSTLRRELKKVTDSSKSIDWDKVSYLSSIMTHEEKFTDDWYKNIFSASPGDAISGEITPEYCTIGRKGIQHIRELCGEVKIIYIIRDPVSRAWSQLKMNMVRNGDYHKAVNKNKKIKDMSYFRKNLRHPSIENRGDYRSYIPEWDVFSENIKYIPFKRIKSEPNVVLQEVSGFIGLESGFEFVDASKTVHQGSGLKMPEEIRKDLKELFSGQYDFLKDRFGQRFFDDI